MREAVQYTRSLGKKIYLTINVFPRNYKIPTFKEALKPMQQLEAATGVGTWFPSESGACVKATSGNIRAAIETMLSREGAAEITQRQQSAYPDMPTGERVESRIVKLLAGLVKK